MVNSHLQLSHNKLEKYSCQYTNTCWKSRKKKNYMIQSRHGEEECEHKRSFPRCVWKFHSKMELLLVTFHSKICSFLILSWYLWFSRIYLVIFWRILIVLRFCRHAFYFFFLTLLGICCWVCTQVCVCALNLSGLQLGSGILQTMSFCSSLLFCLSFLLFWQLMVGEVWSLPYTYRC